MSNFLAENNFTDGEAATVVTREKSTRDEVRNRREVKNDKVVQRCL